MSRLVSNDGKVTEDVVVYVHSSGKKEAKRCDSVDGFVIRSPVFIRTSTTVRECNTQNISWGVNLYTVCSCALLKVDRDSRTRVLLFRQVISIWRCIAVQCTSKCIAGRWYYGCDAELVVEQADGVDRATKRGMIDANLTDLE
ncbi:hypothetical protein ACFE04_021552 [Oxalis oulophora]